MFKIMINLLIYPVALSVFLFCALTYIFLAVFIKPKHLHPIVRLYTWLVLFCSGQILKVEGSPPSEEYGPYLYLINHESVFDVFMVGAAVKHYFSGAASAEQFSWPIWGLAIKRYGAVPINRQHLSKAIFSLSLVEEKIKEGMSFLMAPEGTRSIDGRLQPFKKGPFHIAKNTGVTIVPVGLIGVFEAKPKTSWLVKPGCLIINFGKRILACEYEKLSVEELRDLTRERIAELISES